jgi:hypothetical protein
MRDFTFEGDANRRAVGMRLLLTESFQLPGAAADDGIERIERVA